MGRLMTGIVLVDRWPIEAVMGEAHVFEHGRGRVTITPLGPRTSHFVVEGALDDVHAHAITAEGSRISRDGDGIALHDWSKLQSYTSSARAKLTDWMMEHRQGFASVHILVSSNLVAMGVNVANLALGGFLHAGTDAAAFATVVEAHRRR
jgi:hypothetical protein